MFDPFLRRYRTTIINKLLPEIRKYREDPTLNNSPIIRGAVDHDNGKLSDTQVGEVVLCLMLVGTENTTLGLCATLIDLARNPRMWERVKGETSEFILKGDIASLLSAPLLDACVMESARMNTHIFPLVRTGVATKTLGEYYIGDADCVALCEPLMMLHESNVFKNPTVYHPDRFIGKSAEPKKTQRYYDMGCGYTLVPR